MLEGSEYATEGAPVLDPNRPLRQLPRRYSRWHECGGPAKNLQLGFRDFPGLGLDEVVQGLDLRISAAPILEDPNRRRLDERKGANSPGMVEGEVEGDNRAVGPTNQIEWYHPAD